MQEQNLNKEESSYLEEQVNYFLKLCEEINQNNQE